MVNHREQPPLPHQQQLSATISQITRSVLPRKLLDWDLLPAPDLWYDAGRTPYGAAKLLVVVFVILALLLLLGSPILGIFSIALILVAALVFQSAHSYATDGVVDWFLNITVNFDLYRDLEKAVRIRFHERGYRFVDVATDSELNDPETKKPMGRMFVIVRVPAGSPIQQGPDNYDCGLSFHIYFRLAGKTQIPFFKMKLGHVTAENYRAALILQGDIMDVLNALNHKSYLDIRKPMNR